MVLLFPTGPLWVWGTLRASQMIQLLEVGWLLTGVLDWVQSSPSRLVCAAGVTKRESGRTEGLWRPRPCSINVQSKSQHAPKFQGWRNKTPLLNGKSNRINLQRLWIQVGKELASFLYAIHHNVLRLINIFTFSQIHKIFRTLSFHQSAPNCVIIAHNWALSCCLRALQIRLDL